MTIRTFPAGRYNDAVAFLASLGATYKHLYWRGSHWAVKYA